MSVHYVQTLVLYIWRCILISNQLVWPIPSVKRATINTYIAAMFEFIYEYPYYKPCFYSGKFSFGTDRKNKIFCLPVLNQNECG